MPQRTRSLALWLLATLLAFVAGIKVIDAATSHVYLGVGPGVVVANDSGYAASVDVGPNQVVKWNSAGFPEPGLVNRANLDPDAQIPGGGIVPNFTLPITGPSLSTDGGPVNAGTGTVTGGAGTFSAGVTALSIDAGTIAGGAVSGSTGTFTGAVAALSIDAGTIAGGALSGASLNAGGIAATAGSTQLTVDDGGVKPAGLSISNGLCSDGIGALVSCSTQTMNVGALTASSMRDQALNAGYIKSDVSGNFSFQVGIPGSDLTSPISIPNTPFPNASTFTLVTTNAGVAMGTTQPLSLTDASMTGLAAGGATNGTGAIGVVSGSFASAASEQSTGANQAGLGSTAASGQPYSVTYFPGQTATAIAAIRHLNGDEIRVIEMLPLFVGVDQLEPVYARIAYRSDLGANLKWRLWFYYRASATGFETPITPTFSVTALVYVPQVVLLTNVPVGAGLGVQTLGQGSAGIPPLSASLPVATDSSGELTSTMPASTVFDSATSQTFKINNVTKASVDGSGFKPAAGAAYNTAVYDSAGYLDDVANGTAGYAWISNGAGILPSWAPVATAGYPLWGTTDQHVYWAADLPGSTTFVDTGSGVLVNATMHGTENTDFTLGRAQPFFSRAGLQARPGAMSAGTATVTDGLTTTGTGWIEVTGQWYQTGSVQGIAQWQAGADANQYMLLYFSGNTLVAEAHQNANTPTVVPNLTTLCGNTPDATHMCNVKLHIIFLYNDSTHFQLWVNGVQQGTTTTRTATTQTLTKISINGFTDNSSTATGYSGGYHFGTGTLTAAQIKTRAMFALSLSIGRAALVEWGSWRSVLLLAGFVGLGVRRRMVATNDNASKREEKRAA